MYRTILISRTKRTIELLIAFNFEFDEWSVWLVITSDLF